MSRALSARDPLTYRRQTLEFRIGWGIDTDSAMLATLIASMVTALARRWRERYSVSMPIARIEWEVIEEHSRKDPPHPPTP